MDAFWIQFKANLKLAFAHAEVWVLSIWGIVEVYWQTMMSDADKTAFLDSMPFGLGKFLPLALFVVSYFVAHGWPQPKLDAKMAVSQANVEAKISQT